MNKKEKALLKEIKLDCLRLKRKGDLTEFGWGQLVLIYILEGKAWKNLADYIIYIFHIIDKIIDYYYSAQKVI